MNEITIKLTCTCGAAFEATVEDNNRAWLRAQFNEWQQTHRRCTPGKPALLFRAEPEPPNVTPLVQTGGASAT